MKEAGNDCGDVERGGGYETAVGVGGDGESDLDFPFRVADGPVMVEGVVGHVGEGDDDDDDDD